MEVGYSKILIELLGMFQDPKMFAEMAVLIDPETENQGLVNSENYKEHLVFTLYVAPENKRNDPLYALKKHLPFTPFYEADYNDFNRMLDAFAYQLKEVVPEATADDLNTIIGMTIKKAVESKDAITEVFGRQY